MVVDMVDFQCIRRFFLPNEDCEVVRAALELFDKMPSEPLFVTGSGMLALDLLDILSCPVTLIDIQDIQTKYCLEVIEQIKKAKNTKVLIDWLKNTILPSINNYYADRGVEYTFSGVINALKEYFRIKFFFSDDQLFKIQKNLVNVKVQTADIISYLDNNKHDFVHLSNIVDYMTENQLSKLFSKLKFMKANVFCIETNAMADHDLFLNIIVASGFSNHKETSKLQAMNHALGGNIALKPWMRTGFVHLLLAEQS
ncbi:MAG: hypothetical protein IJT59_04530 [Desulfovibrionaceae bacterium]|nr:hypothetical protein [Desulfovibrionaceae bacterium]